MSRPESWIQIIEPNLKGRDFVVGDMHGCLQEFLLLLSSAQFNPLKDRVFSVGDLIDRGSHSKECLELLLKPWFYAVRGNHEQMLLEHWEEPGPNAPYDLQWIEGLGKDDIEFYKKIIESLPLVMYVQGKRDFFVLHAELWDNARLITNEDILKCQFDDSVRSKVLWSRHMLSVHQKHEETDRRFHSSSLSRIFCGHTIVQMPMIVEKAVYLDTGAFAPYLDPLNAESEHYGLCLMESSTLTYWLAPTCRQFRGSVITMDRLTLQLSDQSKPKALLPWQTF